MMLRVNIPVLKFNQFVKEDAKPSPVVQDYIRHLEKGIASHDAYKAKEHYRKAVATHRSLNAAGRREADKLMQDHHRAWLKQAHDNYDLDEE
jgi:hypothetical protein